MRKRPFHLRQIVRPDLKDHWYPRLFAVGSLIFSAYYFYWRYRYSFNLNSLVISWLLYIAEIYGWIRFILFVMDTWKVEHKHLFQRTPGASVDVFVPTYNEELELLELTILATDNIRYPHTTYILDDGKRPEVKELAEKYGCQYITRDNNLHAKAGNINNAFAQTSGDFILFLDADFVAQPDIIDQMLGYFVDEKVALVQVPQEFYNLDSIQHDHRMRNRHQYPWQEQSVFFDVIMTGKQKWNAAFWCGSPTLMRRKALADVNGVATETLTEDIQTTVRMHRRGWKTIYLPKPMAFGIAPQTLGAFLIQRFRWATDLMQLMASRDAPYRGSGLSLAQRMSYCSNSLYYFDAFHKFICVLIPVITVLIGKIPIDVDIPSFTWRWGLHFVLIICAKNLVGRRKSIFFWTEFFHLLTMFIFMKSSLSLLSRKPQKFQVTPKRTTEDLFNEEKKFLIPQTKLLALFIAGFLFGIYQCFYPVFTYSRTMDYIYFPMIWLVFDILMMIATLTLLTRRRYFFREYRFNERIRGEVDIEGFETYPTWVNHLSSKGLSLMVPNNSVEQGTLVDIRMCISKEDWISIKALVKNRRKHDHEFDYAGVQIVAFPSELERRRYLEFVYVTLPKQAIDKSIAITQVDELLPIVEEPRKAA